MNEFAPSYQFSFLCIDLSNPHKQSLQTFSHSPLSSFPLRKLRLLLKESPASLWKLIMCCLAYYTAPACHQLTWETLSKCNFKQKTIF